MGLFTTYFASPIGWIKLSGTDEAIGAVTFIEELPPVDFGTDASAGNVPELLRTCQTQLEEYFAGTRLHFDLPMAPVGTPFQNRGWEQLVEVKYGTTCSYLAVAKAVCLMQQGGQPERLVRAVGSANGRNPLGILVPCHRVIGSDGKLVGYAGGLWRKQWLLAHESKRAGAGQLSMF